LKIEMSKEARQPGNGNGRDRSRVELSAAGRELQRKIRDRSAQIGVLGLESAGLALALQMAGAGFRVTGVDMDGERVDAVNSGAAHLVDGASDPFLSYVTEGRIKATQSLAVLEDCDVVALCITSAPKQAGAPDALFVRAGIEAVRNNLRRGHLVILGNAGYPERAREVVSPILEQSGLQVGKDFFLAAYSGDVDAGAVGPNRKASKVIGGMTQQCAELAMLLFQQGVEKGLKM
jgi:UDP-N-acetyl-D-glucosamine dehydrogenase